MSDDVRRLLKQDARSFQKAAENAEAARGRLKQSVAAAAEAGVPETEISKLAGVTRMTVRAWLGK